MTDEEKNKIVKRGKAQGREVSPQELPTDLRLFRLERIIADLESRIKHLESRDSARGLSGILIGGKL